MICKKTKIIDSYFHNCPSLGIENSYLDYNTCFDLVGTTRGEVLVKDIPCDKRSNYDETYTIKVSFREESNSCLFSFELFANMHTTITLYATSPKSFKFTFYSPSMNFPNESLSIHHYLKYFMH